MKIKVKLDPGAVMPTRAHPEDAGMDLYAPKRAVVFPGAYERIDLGVHIQIPEGYVGLMTSKSGLMAQGITCRGTIDAGYTGSISAVIYNHSPERIIFDKGQKVTQLVILPCALPDLELADDLQATHRGSGGFGSTGR